MVMATCPSCGNGLVEQARFCPHCGTRLDERPRAQEFRIVTVLFCDVVRSTAMEQRLGQQPMQLVMDQYGQTVRQQLGGLGASISRRHGDGYMAAFGAGELHEDDALRAVRAASGLRGALRGLDEQLRRDRGIGLDVRIGINTGNVLVRGAGTQAEELTGQAVNLAKRFEQAAGTGEILLGEETYRLVSDAVKAEPAGSLTLEDIAEPQDVWRLQEVLLDRPGRARRWAAPMVGRDREQGLLLQLFERSSAEHCCHLVSVLGSAGVGKTRLVDEFLRGLDERATVLRAHCPAFGDSVTVWPLVEIVREAAGIAASDPLAVARARLAELLGGEERGELLTERVAQLLGFGPDAGLPEDTFWALQRLLETLARRRPIVLVIDDLHWADTVLLDALDHIAEYSGNVPIMLLCMARADELFARRGHWPGGKTNAFSFQLSPLPEREGEQLVSNLLGGRVDQEVQAHISEWAQGFPLLVEELVAGLRDEGRLVADNGRWMLRLDPRDAIDHPARPSVPMSIHALLLARLDRLSASGRVVVEPAAVVGQQFHLGDVRALAPEVPAADLDAGLQELVRLDLIHPDGSPASVPLPPDSGRGYRFRHATIKTVAYERLPDDRRAELHERYADWLERETGDRSSQFDEIIGLHLYEAFRYASKLEPGGERTRTLARRAGERYAAAGHRAAVRGDTGLVQAWLGRAARLLPADHPVRLRALPPLAEALRVRGKLTEAAQAYHELARSATTVGNDGLALHATIGRLGIDALHSPALFLKEGRDEIELAIAAFERLGDRLGLAKAWHLLAHLDWTRGRLTQAGTAAERAWVLAREAGDPSWEANAIGLHCLLLYWGPTPLDKVEARSREALAEAERIGVFSLMATGYRVLARVAVHRADVSEARRLMDMAAAIEDRGEELTRATDCISRAMVDLIDDDLAAAHDTLEAGYGQLEQMGGTGPQVSVAAMLARVLLLQGSNDEAERLTVTCERLAAPDQADAQVKWRSIRAIALARRGEAAEAERLAREAVHLVGRTDQLDSRAEAHRDLAEVLLLGGRGGEATSQLERAIRLYREKGSEVGERGAQRLLARTRP
jgi:class 3 adenylate cyclase/tetratricopeptide (TPR) repeat protein